MRRGRGSFRAERPTPPPLVPFFSAEQAHHQRPNPSSQSRPGILFSTHGWLQLPAEPPLDFVQITQRQRLHVEQQIVVSALPLLRQRDQRTIGSLRRVLRVIDTPIVAE